jgi:hypothetical protein
MAIGSFISVGRSLDDAMVGRSRGYPALRGCVVRVGMRRCVVASSAVASGAARRLLHRRGEGGGRSPGRASSSSGACVFRREASVFRNTSQGSGGGWLLLCICEMHKRSHPLAAAGKVLRNARQSPTGPAPGTADAREAAGASLTATLLPSMRPYAPRRPTSDSGRPRRALSPAPRSSNPGPRGPARRCRRRAAGWRRWCGPWRSPGCP